MRFPLLRLGPACLAIAALACGSAQARTSVSVDLNLGLPIGGYYGHSYGGPVYAAPIYATPVYAAPAYGTVYNALPAGAVSVYVGGGRYWRHGGVYYRPWGPSWVVVAPPVVVPVARSAPLVRAAAPAPAPRRPDPVIAPRNGQSAAQTEYDRQQCNRWATTLPAAMAEASVFHRAVEACMDGRGYTMK